MIKSILVVASGTDGDAATFATALGVARLFAAHLEVLCVRLDAVNTAVAMTTEAGTGVMTAGLVERLEQDAREREARTREAFDRFRAGAALVVAEAPHAGGSDAASAQFRVETGEEARWVGAYGIVADLIVAGRGDGEGAGARSTIEAALIDTGRPILIPAVGASPLAFRRIAIAWKPSPPAAHAVAFAMPFLARAEQVLVVTAEEAAEARQDGEALVRSLAWHGIAATAERVVAGADGAAASLLAAIQGRADLLVMGGYGHSRLREWVFGGFTQHVLATAPLPVLIAH